MAGESLADVARHAAKPRIKLGAVASEPLQSGHQEDSRTFQTEIDVVAMAARLPTSAWGPCPLVPDPH